MLHINDLSFRIEGRPIFEGATVAIPEGHKVGLVGRKGAGKTTLLRLITGEAHPDAGVILLPRNHRIGYVAQEAPGGDLSLIDWVLSTDTERASLLAEGLGFFHLDRAVVICVQHQRSVAREGESRNLLEKTQKQVFLFHDRVFAGHHGRHALTDLKPFTCKLVVRTKTIA